MGYTYRQELTKFDYAICLAASLAYLMISQHDPVGLITFSDRIRESLPPRSKRKQLGNLLSLLARQKPVGETDIAGSLQQIAALLKHKTLVMIFSDLLVEVEPVRRALHRLRHGGHDVILFHILDEAEVQFPFQGACELEDPESGQKLQVDANSVRSGYQQAIADFRGEYRLLSQQAGIDYVELDTSMPFDRALTEYLLSRRARG
jgi:uncharacterized protein (DUF58 family)